MKEKKKNSAKGLLIVLALILKVKFEFILI